jgi:hypothetical protein
MRTKQTLFLIVSLNMVICLGWQYPSQSGQQAECWQALRGGGPKSTQTGTSQGVNKPPPRKAWFKKKTDGPLEIWLALINNTTFAV